MNKHKLIQFAMGLFFSGIALTLLVSNYPTTTVSQSVVTETNNSRILIYGNDTQLIEYYEKHLEEKRIADEEDQKLYTKTNEIECVAGFDIELVELKVVESSPEPTKKPKSNRWGIKLSKNEVELLAKIVFKECHLESDKGKIAVIETIFNRMKHKSYGGSLYEILSSKHQFSTWRSRNSAKPTNEEYKNIKKVLEGKTRVLSKSYVYFSTTPRNNKGTVKIGNHYFCQY